MATQAIPDKLLIMKTFNKQFFDFLDDVIRSTESNDKIKIARSHFETLKKMNPSLIIKIWYNHIYIPYKSIILQGDFSFFLEKDYTEDVSKLQNAKEVIYQIETAVKEPIRNMNSVNQSHCMGYIKLLSQLSEVYSDV